MPRVAAVRRDRVVRMVHRQLGLPYARQCGRFSKPNGFDGIIRREEESMVPDTRLCKCRSHESCHEQFNTEPAVIVHDSPSGWEAMSPTPPLERLNVPAFGTTAVG